MNKVTLHGRTIGHIEKFIGNKPSERWVAFRPRLAGDNGTFPARSQRFSTRRDAVDWLAKMASDMSDKTKSEKSDKKSEQMS